MRKRKRTPSDDMVDQMKAEVYAAIDNPPPLVEGFSAPKTKDIRRSAAVSDATRRKFLRSLKS